MLKVVRRKLSITCKDASVLVTKNITVSWQTHTHTSAPSSGNAQLKIYALLSCSGLYLLSFPRRRTYTGFPQSLIIIMRACTKLRTSITRNRKLRDTLYRVDWTGMSRPGERRWDWINEDMKEKGFSEGDTRDKNEWKRNIENNDIWTFSQNVS